MHALAQLYVLPIITSQSSSHEPRYDEEEPYPKVEGRGVRPQEVSQMGRRLVKHGKLHECGIGQSGARPPVAEQRFAGTVAAQRAQDPCLRKQMSWSRTTTGPMRRKASYSRGLEEGNLAS